MAVEHKLARLLVFSPAGCGQNGLEPGVRQDADAAVRRGEEDLSAAVAKGNLIDLHVLLVGCERRGLLGRKDKDGVCLDELGRL